MSALNAACSAKHLSREIGLHECDYEVVSVFPRGYVYLRQFWRYSDSMASFH